MLGHTRYLRLLRPTISKQNCSIVPRGERPQSGTLLSPEFPAGNRSFKNGRDNWIMPAATAATPAISKKNSVCEKPDHRPPSQPAKKFPAKLVESQIPITVERELPGA